MAFLRISPDTLLLGATFFATFDVRMAVTPPFVSRYKFIRQLTKKSPTQKSSFPHAAAALERVAPPEVRDPTGQTLDPWSPAEICLGIIRPFKSLCVPEWAHGEFYRRVCSDSQPRGNSPTSHLCVYTDWHGAGARWRDGKSLCFAL